MIHQIYKTNGLERFQDGRSNSLFVMSFKKGFEVDHCKFSPRRLARLRTKTGHCGSRQLMLVRDQGWTRVILVGNIMNYDTEKS